MGAKGRIRSINPLAPFFVKVKSLNRTVEIEFEQAVREYSERLYYVVRRIVKSHDDANDVVQNTFLKAWQNFTRFRGESGLYTWLYRIAINESLVFIRNNSKFKFENSNEAQRELRQLYDNDPYFDGDTAEKALAMAIDTLPAKQKVVFNMRYFDEMPYSEMAEIMQTSQGALKASYHHAQKKVELQLNLFMENLSNH